MLSEYELYDYSTCFEIDDCSGALQFEFAVEQDSVGELLHCVDQIIMFLQARTKLKFEGASFRFFLSCPDALDPTSVDSADFESKFKRLVRARWIGSASDGVEELERHIFELRSKEHNAKALAEFSSKCAATKVEDCRALFGYDLLLPRLARTDSTKYSTQFSIEVPNSPYSMLYRFYDGEDDKYKERFVFHSDLIKASLSSRSLVECANRNLLECSSIEHNEAYSIATLSSKRSWRHAFLPSHCTTGDSLLTSQMLVEIQELLGSEEIFCLGSCFVPTIESAKYAHRGHHWTGSGSRTTENERGQYFQEQRTFLAIAS